MIPNDSDFPNYARNALVARSFQTVFQLFDCYVSSVYLT